MGKRVFDGFRQHVGIIYVPAIRGGLKQQNKLFKGVSWNTKVAGSKAAVIMSHLSVDGGRLGM